MLSIAACVAAVWGTLAMLRGPLVLGVLGVLLTAAALGRDFAVFEIGPVQMTLDRIALLALIGTYIVRRRFGQTDRSRCTPGLTGCC